MELGLQETKGSLAVFSSPSLPANKLVFILVFRITDGQKEPWKVQLDTIRNVVWIILFQDANCILLALGTPQCLSGCEIERTEALYTVIKSSHAKADRSYTKPIFTNSFERHGTYLIMDFVPNIICSGVAFHDVLRTIDGSQHSRPFNMCCTF